MTTARLPVPETGTTIGLWTVVGPSVRGADRYYHVPVRCACGLEAYRRISLLHRGLTTSCHPCAIERQVEEAPHGHARGDGRGGKGETPTYRSWRAMHSRCRYPGVAGYPNYGGRGITVCERWQSFEAFLADMGERPEGMTLDRIDVDGGYEPANCRWATPTMQTQNRRRAG